MKILRALFNGEGLKGAVKHDAIVDQSNPEHIIVEYEGETGEEMGREEREERRRGGREETSIVLLIWFFCSKQNCRESGGSAPSLKAIHSKTTHRSWNSYLDWQIRSLFSPSSLFLTFSISSPSPSFFYYYLLIISSGQAGAPLQRTSSTTAATPKPRFGSQSSNLLATLSSPSPSKPPSSSSILSSATAIPSSNVVRNFGMKGKEALKDSVREKVAEREKAAMGEVGFANAAAAPMSSQDLLQKLRQGFPYPPLPLSFSPSLS